MQRLAYLALIGAANANKKSMKDAKKVEAIVGGILRGAIDAEGFTDINTCIKDVETVYGDAKTAVEDFEQKSAQGAIAGIKEVAEMLQFIKAHMQDCTSIKADWEKLAKMAAIFESPTSFAYHVGKDLIVNGKQIYHEIDTAVADYKAANWGDFGYNIGEAAAKTILGDELPMHATNDQKIKEAQIMQGFLTAFGGKFDLWALLMCIYEEDQALLMFDVAVQSFEEAIAKKDPSEAIGGVIAVIAGVSQFKKGLPACEAIDTSLMNYKQFDQCMDVAVHPTQYFKVLEKDLLVNNKAIMADVVQAIMAYKSEKYYEFGQLMGSIVEMATEKPETEALTVVENPDQADVTRQMIAEFAQGFLETTQVGEFNFTNLLICIYEADQAAMILYQAVEILEEAYHDKDPEEAIGGVIATIAFLQQLKQSIPVCEAVDKTPQDWTHFNHIVDTLEDPKDHMAVIGKDIVMNGKTITEDIGDALEAFRAGDFLLFGRMLGKVMYIATEGNPADLFLY
jgi:hypothetical protein